MKTTSDRVCTAVGIVTALLLVAGSTTVSAASRPQDAAVLLAQAAPAQPAADAASPPPAPAAQPSAAGTAPSHGPAELVEARITQLHQQLHITAEEEPQFKAFADVMRSNAQAMQALFQEHAGHPDATAVGQLDWYAKLTAAHSDAVNKLVPVFGTLYQGLTAQQKKTADTVFAQLEQRREASRSK
ncbi:MAG: Spy/CpxP family protein refolding chaperone [Alphaproteobacteria bacterium]|nr:Spy/CpxP family protein refolding chaperone [Alphaproteobacteria bacterium]